MENSLSSASLEDCRAQQYLHSNKLETFSLHQEGVELWKVWSYGYRLSISMQLFACATYLKHLSNPNSHGFNRFS
jgi:hypothetical protein